MKCMMNYNKQVPPHGKGTLYLRPLLMGTGSVFGIAPAPEYTFLIFASPIANHYKVYTYICTLRFLLDYISKLSTIL